MNDKIFSSIRHELSLIGDEKISGNDVLKLMQSVIDKLSIPREVEFAMKYIASCHADLGFCGSPEYERYKKIVDKYTQEQEAIKL